jgi:hypothetical protein
MKPIPAHLYLAYVLTMEMLVMAYPVKFDLEKARKVFDGCLEMCEELGLMASTASAQKIGSNPSTGYLFPSVLVRVRFAVNDPFGAHGGILHLAHPGNRQNQIA